jgi:SiaC family regulatory phosphoprotein
MDQLHLEATEDTPAVTIDKAQGIFKITGRSLPEDVKTFYRPVMEWLDLFAASPAPALTLDINLEYFNTASSKIILDILMKLEEIHEAGSCKIKVNWHYEDRDDDMLEAGEEYSELVEIPFELIPFSNKS